MKNIYLLLIALLFSPTSAIFAQQDMQDSTFSPSVREVLALPIKKVEKVSVASNVITDQEKQPASVTTVTKEQIRNCGARTLSDVLTLYVPGYFAVEDQDDVIAGFRGLAPDNNSKVLLLINGQNMNTEFFFGPPDAILNSPDMEYIERIEVIRGPGSVTLGQGALLGVINIITKDAGSVDGSSVGGSVSYGKNDWLSGNAYLQTNYKGLKGFFYASGIRYDGQAMRNEGWAKLQGNQGFAGGKVADMGHRIKRTDNTTFHGNIQYKGLSISIMQLNQRRDLYNFYRDREVVGQNILSLGADYAFRINDKISNKTSISAIEDNYSTWSLTGTAMGGTAERRLGLKSVFNIDELWKNNRLAVGVEARLFQMGLPNREGNNYIANVIGTFNPQTANKDLTAVYGQNVRVLSVFLEDFYSVSKKFDLFAALRFDNHPFWGNNFTPRFGAIYSPNKNLILRGSFQTGFRSAVGLHYAGGYRRDGFLRATNYSEVVGANIPNEQNINSVKPETMQSFELAVSYKKSGFSLNGVVFYTLVSNVIDVGVIYRDRVDPQNPKPDQFNLTSIGSDLAGDWNGFWFFKNTPGTFSQIGTEITLNYKYKWLDVGGSYAYAGVAATTQEQKELAEKASSMYLASDPEAKTVHYKAFPEHTFRLYGTVNPIKPLHLSTNLLAYSSWYSPIGTKAGAGFILNSSISCQITKGLEFSLIGRNLLDENALYPMNSNAGGRDVSPGTPAWESTTFWGVLRVRL